MSYYDCDSGRFRGSNGQFTSERPWDDEDDSFYVCTSCGFRYKGHAKIDRPIRINETSYYSRSFCGDECYEKYSKAEVEKFIENEFSYSYMPDSKGWLLAVSLIHKLKKARETNSKLRLVYTTRIQADMSRNKRVYHTSIMSLLRTLKSFGPQLIDDKLVQIVDLVYWEANVASKQVSPNH